MNQRENTLHIVVHAAAANQEKSPAMAAAAMKKANGHRRSRRNSTLAERPVGMNHGSDANGAADQTARRRGTTHSAICNCLKKRRPPAQKSLARIAENRPGAHRDKFAAAEAIMAEDVREHGSRRNACYKNRPPPLSAVTLRSEWYRLCCHHRRQNGACLAQRQ